MNEPAHIAGKKPLWGRITSHPLTHLAAAIVVLGLMQGFVVKLFVVPSGSMQQTLEIGDRILVNRLAYGLPWQKQAPERGDVIVFAADDELWPDSPTSDVPSAAFAVKHAIKFVFGDLIGIGPTTRHTLVKRVIGLPGETVTCCSASGNITVDDTELLEPYIFEDYPFEPDTVDCESTPVSQRCFAPLTVPDGMLLVLGDHRSQSGDGVVSCRGLSANTGVDCARWARITDVTGKTFASVWPFGTIRVIT